MRKIFNYFNLFGLKIPLPFKNKQIYQSYLGLIFTLILVIFGIIFFFYFSQDFLHKKNPQINESNEIIPTNTNLSLSLKQNKLFFAFGIYSDYFKHSFINNSIYSFELYNVISNSSNRENGEKYIKIPTGPCTKKQLFQNKLLKEYFNSDVNYYVNRYFCINQDEIEKIFINGTTNDNDYNYLNFVFRFCNPNKNNSNCSSENEIKKVLSGGYINIFYIDANFNPNDYKKPFQNVVKYKYFYFTYLEKKILEFDYLKYELITDNGLIFSNKNSKNIFKMRDTIKIDESHLRQSLDLEFCNIYLLLSNEKKDVIRNYDKIPKILAEVGGLLNIFFIFLKIIITPFLKISFFKEIINSIYFYKEYKNKKKNINKKIEITSVLENINNADYKVVDLINCLKTKLKAFNFKFFDIFKTFYCKKSNQYQKLNKILKQFKEKIEITYYLKKIHEIEIIKMLIFDSNQQKILKSFPIIYDNTIIDEKKEKKIIKMLIFDSIKNITKFSNYF